MPAVADIVETNSHPGRWIVRRPYFSGRGAPAWQCSNPATGETISFADAALSVISTPVFAPSQMLTHQGQRVEVVADLGETIACRFPDLRRPLRGDGRVHVKFPNRKGECERGALVLANYSFFASQEA